MPFAQNATLVKRHMGSFVAKRKAALRKHIATVHPEWKEAIRW